MRLSSLLLITLISVTFLTPGAGWSDVPEFIHFQGILTDDDDLPLTGSYSMTFRIYTDTTLAAVWSLDADPPGFSVSPGS